MRIVALIKQDADMRQINDYIGTGSGAIHLSATLQQGWPSKLP